MMLLVAALIFITASNAIGGEFTNVNIRSVISLKNPALVKIESTFNVRAVESSRPYILSLLNPQNMYIYYDIRYDMFTYSSSYIEVIRNKRPVAISKGEVNAYSADKMINQYFNEFKYRTMQSFSVDLGNLKANDEVEFDVTVIYSKLLKPLPKEVVQGGESSYEFIGNLHVISPYATEEETITVR